jgi:hypothetical protein
MRSQRSWQRLDLRCYRRSRCLLIFIFVLLALPLSATTYYIDCNGADSNNGTSTSTPWRTIAKVNGSSFSAGDSVLLKAGCTWREQLTVPSSGAAGSPITFGAYGTGNKPIITGLQTLTGLTWAQDGSATRWYSSLASNPWVLLVDGEMGITKTSASAVLTDYDFYYDGTGRKLYVGGATSPASRTLQRSTLGNNINTNSQSHLVIGGLDLRGGGWENLEISNSPADITVDNISSSFSFRDGVNSHYSGHVTDGITITNSTLSMLSVSGLSLGQAKNIVVVGNTIYSYALNDAIDYANGIQIGDAVEAARLMTGVTIRDNEIYYGGQVRGVQISTGDHGEGIHTDTVGVGAIICRNKVHDLGNPRIIAIHAEIPTYEDVFDNVIYNVAGVCLGATTWGANAMDHAQFFNNTARNCGVGIEILGPYPPISGGVTKMAVENNIVSSSALAFRAIWGGENDGTYGSENIYGYNAFGPQVANFFEWGANNYLSTYSAFDSAYGSSTHSPTGDPKFTNAAAGNFTLQAGSPAIDAGTNLGAVYQMALDPRTTFPWGPLNQNSQGLGWEIGAFVFVHQIPPSPPTSLSATVE